MRRLLGLSALLLLAACATGGAKSPAANQIRQEMDAAVSREGAKPEAAVSEALLPPLAVPLQPENKPVEPRFDLVVNNTAAQQVFMAIVSGTRYSVLLHPDVSGFISLNLKDVTVFEALEAIRELYGYDYKVDGTRIYIQPLTLQTRIFQVNYLTGTRAGTSSVRVTSSALTDTSMPTTGGVAGLNTNQGTTIVGGGEAKPLKFERGTDNSSKVTTITSTDFWDELGKALKLIVGEENGRSIVISPMSGVIVVRAMPEELKNVAAYLKASQISIERQVILEAKIVEVQLNESFQSGVNWAGFMNRPNSRLSAGQGAAGSALSPTAGTALSSPILTATPGSSLLPAAAGLPTGATAGTLFGLAFQTSNFAALLNFLETQGDVHVLSSPRIATLNNQKAVLKVGTDEFFVTEVTGGTQATTALQGTAPTVKVQPFFSGIALDVTPRIDENNEIILHVHPSVSTVSTVNKTVDLGVSNGIANIFNLPLASSSVSETDSIVRARDGQIVAIGGLMRQAQTNNDSGIPGLPKGIFGQTNHLTEKRELVILLKPTVVDSDKDWADDIARSRDRLNGMSR
jgi:MSHA biogenesis protein MshL